MADEPRYRIVTHLGARVGRLNPSWQASPGQNAIFGPGNSEVTEVCVPSENSLWLKLVLHVQSGGCSPLPSCSAFSRTAFVWRRGDNGGILQGIPCGGKIGWMWGPHDINVTEVDILCHFWNWGQRVSAMFVPQG